MKKPAPTVQSLIAEIKARLQTIEEHMAWLIKADTRFRIGQRVEFSRMARRKVIVPKTRLALKGTVKGLSPFSVDVQLDGQKQRRSFHHALFNPVSGPKLF